METTIDYWFVIEPYVFVSITNKCALLYNTLDGKTIESDKIEIIELLRKVLNEENCGIVLLTSEEYKRKEIHDFVKKLRCSYMGDIIDVNLSKDKPVQVMPYFNFPNKYELYKKHNFSPFKNILENLFEISIHVDVTTNVSKLILFLQSIMGKPTFNLIGNIGEVHESSELLSYFNKHTSLKNIICSYENLIPLQPDFDNNYSYRILVHFPIDMQQWNRSREILLNQTLPIEYVFVVTSDEDCLQAEQIIKQIDIKKYQFKPLYTGENVCFFENNVFLNKEDILSIPISMKDLFIRQAINIYDFGKINIMPNGDVYANLNHPMLGNIYTDNIYEIVHKEVDEGKSWFRIRNQAPCTDCVYQWLCPSPSNYEIEIGRPNLCFVKQRFK